MCVPKWKLQLLGGVVATRGDFRVDRFQTKHTTGLLAYLATRPGEAVPRDLLTNLLWGEGDRKQLRNRLNQAISTIRKLMEPISGGPLFSSSHFALAAQRDAFNTDVAELEELAAEIHSSDDAEFKRRSATRASELYKGDFLPGVDFEWAVVERARLRSMFVQALGEGVAACLDQDKLEDAAVLAAARTKADPSERQHHLDFVRLLLSVGRPQQAIVHISSYETGLELKGLRLDPELQELRSQALALPQAATLPIPVPGGGQDQRRIALPSEAPPLGREEELDSLRTHLSEGKHRLVTLTGIGGLDKTRLMIAAVRTWANATGASAVLVRVAAEAHAAGPACAILASFGSGPAGSEAEAVARLHGFGPIVVALDGVEEMPADWVELLDQLIKTCPGVTIVAAGRRPIGSAFELRVALKPLRTEPAPGEEEAPAVLHFLNCAERRVPGSGQVATDAVRQICRLLGGHPLATELAAGWSRILDLGSIRERLERSQDLLVDTSLPSSARNSSFAAVVNSSLDLATPQAREAFAALAVFESPARLDAAEALGGVTPVSVRELEELGLVKSVQQPDGVARLSLLGAVREHARSQWTPDLRKRLSDAHAQTFYDRAKAADEGAPGPKGMEGLGCVSLEFRDHAAAIQHALSAGRAKEALHHACVVARLAEMGQHLAESVRLLEGALAGHRENDSLQLRAQVQLARILWHGGSFARARELASTSVAEGERLGHTTLWTDALAVLQAEAHRVGDYDQAHEMLERSLAIAESVGNFAGQARARLGMGNLRMEQGRFSDAQSEYLESLLLARQARDQFWEVAALANLAHLAHLSQRDEAALGFVAQASEAAGRSPSFARLMHAVRSVQVHSLLSLGRTEAAEAALWAASNPWPEGETARIEVLTAAADYYATVGEPERTAKILGYLATMTKEGGHAPGMEHQRRSAIGEKASIALGERRYAELFLAGSALTADEARQFADPGSAPNGVSVL